MSIGSVSVIEPYYSTEMIKRLTLDFLSYNREKDINPLIDNPEFYSNNHFIAVNLL